MEGSTVAVWPLSPGQAWHHPAGGSGHSGMKFHGHFSFFLLDCEHLESRTVPSSQSPHPLIYTAKPLNKE